jgi:hypothetical protein
MKRFTRLTVFASVAALALAVVATAAASYTPSMGVFQATYKPAGAGTVLISLAQEKADDPTARIVIYAPQGYKATLTQAPGTQIGSVIADVQVLDLSTNPIALSGPVKVDSPANWTAQANLCTPGVVPEAVWTLNAGVAGQTNIIPVFVTHTTGAEAAFSSAKMTVCFRDPTLPQNDPRRSPNGTKFLDAAFSVKGVFTNSSSAGNQLWRSLFTPYTPGTGAPNAAGTREAQGIAPSPYSVSIKRVRARRGFLRFAGIVNVAGSLPSGPSLALYAGVKGKNGIVAFKKVGSTRARKGKYVFNRRLPRKVTYYFVERPPTLAACASPLVSCTTAIVSNTISKVVKVAPPRRRH